MSQKINRNPFASFPLIIANSYQTIHQEEQPLEVRYGCLVVVLEFIVHLLASLALSIYLEKKGEARNSRYDQQLEQVFLKGEEISLGEWVRLANKTVRFLSANETPPLLFFLTKLENIRLLGKIATIHKSNRPQELELEDISLRFDRFTLLLSKLLREVSYMEDLIWESESVITTGKNTYSLEPFLREEYSEKNNSQTLLYLYSIEVSSNEFQKLVYCRYEDLLIGNRKTRTLKNGGQFLIKS